MDTAEPVTVDWPSLLLALLIDSLLVWAPAASLFFLAPGHQVPLALGLVLTALAANCALYAGGTTIGTYLCGFRLRTRHQQQPGLSYGLILALLTFASVPAVALLIAVSLTPVNSASGPLGRPVGYPLVGERTHRRRVLQAADDYWERWSD